MSPSRRVLIVDPQEESREVLRTVLEGRGLHCLVASRPEQGECLAKKHRPDLIVLDLEVDEPDADESRSLAAAARQDATPLVILGSVRPKESPRSSGEFVPKPYHYGALVRRIESLLSQRRRAAA